MSIFFATPMYGGKCDAAFHRSAMMVCRTLTQYNIDFTWSTPWNESLITRARNNLVSEFLQTDFRSMMFIDADIEFTPEDINLLWNLDKDISVGAYRMKQEGAPLTVWMDGVLYNIENDTEPMKVDYAGTGFMMIRRDVIEKMIEEYPETAYFEYIYTEEEKKEMMSAQLEVDRGNMTEEEYIELVKNIRSNSDMERHLKYALFDTMIDNYYDGQNVYLSEDYTFCKRWRQIGGEIWCDPKIKLKHWGQKAYG